MSNFDRFMDNVNALARASVRNRFVIERKNSDLLDVPVLVLIIALFLNLPLVLFLMLLGLFLGCRYHFGGNGTVAKSANDMILMIRRPPRSTPSPQRRKRLRRKLKPRPFSDSSR